MTVIFHSMGGLGNQLFQYATARRLALRRGVEVAVDTAWHARVSPDTTPRPFMLPRLRVSVRPLTPGEQRWAGVASNWLVGRIPFTSPWTVRRERSFDFDPAVLSAPGRTYLFGYWQSARYFEDVRAELLGELVPVTPPSPQDVRVLEAARTSSSVMVHVRRGDYVSLKAAAVNHGTCSLDYYREAFEIVARRVPDPVLFVFSDDPAWTRANLKLPAEMVHVDHNSPDAPELDLRLMAACRHAIMANSSLSWWGAWLGPREERVVVAPRRWFADGRPTPDLFPAEWAVV